MIDANDLIALFRIPLSEGWGYIWGTYGQVWTQAKQNAATREMTVKYGQKWVGKRVADCSGMFYWAYKQLGHSIYHGSNTIWKEYLSARGKLTGGARDDGQPIKPGTAVFLYRKSDNCRHHIGLFVGNNTVIEAKGTINGVVTSKLSHWDEWGELKAVNYENVKGETPVQTLRKGSSGEAVRALQEILNGLGYDAGVVDGVYGSRTMSAVRQFQMDNNLDADGIAGQNTLTLLAARSARPDDPPDDDSLDGDQPAPELPEDDDDFDTPTAMIPLTYAEAQRILSALRDIQLILERALK